MPEQIQCRCVGSFGIPIELKILVSNILMANQNQLFDDEWQKE